MLCGLRQKTLFPAAYNGCYRTPPRKKPLFVGDFMKNQITGLCAECVTVKDLPHWADDFNGVCDDCYCRLNQIPLPLDEDKLKPATNDDSDDRILDNNFLSSQTLKSKELSLMTTTATVETREVKPMDDYRERQRREREEREAKFCVPEAEVLTEFGFTKRTLERYRTDGYKGLTLNVDRRYDNKIYREVNYYAPEQIAALRDLKAAAKPNAPAEIATFEQTTTKETALSSLSSQTANAPALSSLTLQHVGDVLQKLAEKLSIPQTTSDLDNHRREFERLNRLLTLNLDEASELTSLSRGHIEAAIKDGTLRAFKHGNRHEYRMTRKSLNEYLETL